MGLVQNNASQDLRIVSVWYAGTKTLTEGAVLVYDTDTNCAPLTSGYNLASPPNLSGAQLVERNLRSHRVIDPAAVYAAGSTGCAAAGSNPLNPFAGVVAPGAGQGYNSTSGSFVGPGFIDIVAPLPGSVANVQISTATAQIGDFVVVDNVTPSDTAYVPNQTGTNGSLAGVGLVSHPLNVTRDLSTAAGLVLTGSTAPPIAALETNFYGVQPAASTTFDGAFNFIVPADYNQSVDILTVAIQIANSTTNTTAITATAYVKATATALSSVVTGTTSATAPISSNGITLFSTFAGKGLKPGQSLWIILTNSAHTTDAVSIYGIDVQYASINALGAGPLGIGTVLATGSGSGSTTTPDLLLVRF